jgi:hypothetical protein
MVSIRGEELHIEKETGEKEAFAYRSHEKVC